MMVHTNVFGLYNGPEEKNEQTELYSVINLLGNYTQTRNIRVKVIDEEGKSVEGATVKFKVFNYAEFYSIATATTNAEGGVSLLSGRGDLFVWANKGDVYGYAKSDKTTNDLTITLNKKKGDNETE